MENRLPVPTDNIFKFYALFGLLLFVFAWGSLFYVTRATNELVFSTLPELEALRAMASRSPAEETRVTLMERKLEIAKKDKAFFLNCIAGLGVLSSAAMAYGFAKWHTEVQKAQDESAAVQLEIAKLQLVKLQRELGIDEGSSSPVTTPPAISSTSADAQPPSDHPAADRAV